MREHVDLKALARFLSGECSEEERKKMEAWILAHPGDRKWISGIRRIWHAHPSEEKVDVESLFSDLKKRLEMPASIPEVKPSNRILPGPVYRPAVRLLRIAAVLAVMVLGTWAGKTLYSGRSMEKITVAYGRRAEILLNDGTRVVLDSGSRFRYPKKLRSGNREVFLEGEGFFDVASDPVRPFVVHARGAAVRVLGTQFNVRAWNPACCVRVSVLEGRVEFRGENTSKNENVILTRGQMSMLSENRVPSSPVPIDTQQEISWMHGEIFMTDAPLHEVLEQLERWYDVSFVVPESSRLDEHVSVHIRGKSLKDNLELISLLSGMEFSLENNLVYLK